MSRYVTRILHVDDDELLLRAVNRSLTANGFVVRSVTCAGDAMQALRDVRFNAALVDLDFGAQPDGFQLIEGLREIVADLPVVILSGSVTAEAIARAQALDVAEVLAKPAHPRELARVLRQCTGISGLRLSSVADVADDDTG